LLATVAAPYGLAVRLRAALYRRGWLRRRRLPVPVISVGNLTLGGTGKTPVVIWLVGRLLERGVRVAVLSRGYRRRSREPRLLVTDGRDLLAGPAEAGDEPHLIARRCPGALVAVGADRYALGQWLLERFPVDCFVLDDGFQHLALHRDEDLLLVDASAPADLEALCPAGRLREPLSAAARATALVLTRADGGRPVEPLLAALGQAGAPAGAPILFRFAPGALVAVTAGREEPACSLAGRKVLLFSGIASPASFQTLAEGVGAVVADHRVFADHHTYRAADVSALLEQADRLGAERLVTTEKDAGKVAPFLGADERVWALRLEPEVVGGRERLERVLSRPGGRVSS
jgi:tetraacyldisaccharide 4'-kinase